jgi:hypothetical protein
MDTFFAGTREDRIGYKEHLLSDDLINAIQNNSKKIIELWLNDISTNPSTNPTTTLIKKSSTTGGTSLLVR